MTPDKTNRRRRKGRFFSFFLTLLFIFFIAALLGVAGICFFTKPVDTSMLTVKMSSVIYYENENHEKVILQSLYDDENRTWVDLEDIPRNMKNAFVAIEDERFFSHPGFDIKRLGGATINAFLRLFNKDRSIYGGSTITQQLVKNLTGEDKQKVLRKVQEIYRAIRLEHDLSKNEILELYLNNIYLSQNCNGVATASRVYFSKNVTDLTLAECACIAGITQYPGRYDPYINPEANKEKQLLVLSKMLELGMISQEEYNEAAAEELHFARDPHSSNSVYSYFVDTVIDEILPVLEDAYGSSAIAQRMLYTGGLQIHCTIDPAIQALLEDTYTDESRFIYRGDAMLQSAMVVLESSTGEIKGIVGGMGEKSGSLILNRANSVRQPGSTIKPIAVYAPALEYGIINSTTLLQDVPTTFTLSDGSTWSPRNSDGSFSGLVPLATALARSLNIPAAITLDKMGIDVSYDFLSKKLGVTSLVDRRETSSGIVSDRALAALSLGGLTDGISPVELAGAYLPFSNNGIYIEPHSFTDIYNYRGELILSREPETHRAMRSSTAVLMTNLLKGVISFGTGTAAAFPGVELAGKTGTATNDHDRWFVGYTPSYIGVTWVGYDTPAPINARGNPAIPIWKAVMSNIDYSDQPVSYDEVLSDDGIAYQAICSVSGRLATNACYESGTVKYVLSEKSASFSYCNASYHDTSEDENEEDEGRVSGEEKNEGETSGSESGSDPPADSNTSSPHVPPPPEDVPPIVEILNPTQDELSAA